MTALRWERLNKRTLSVHRERAPFSNARLLTFSGFFRPRMKRAMLAPPPNSAEMLSASKY
jgi:hypothetical protein